MVIRTLSFFFYLFYLNFMDKICTKADFMPITLSPSQPLGGARKVKLKNDIIKNLCLHCHKVGEFVSLGGVQNVNFKADHEVC